MAFTDDQKTSALKDILKESIEEGTTWADIKAEFLSFPESFRDETLANLQERINAVKDQIGAMKAGKDSLKALKTELTS